MIHVQGLTVDHEFLGLFVRSLKKCFTHIRWTNSTGCAIIVRLVSTVVSHPKAAPRSSHYTLFTELAAFEPVFEPPVSLESFFHLCASTVFRRFVRCSAAFLCDIHGEWSSLRERALRFLWLNWAFDRTPTAWHSQRAALWDLRMLFHRALCISVFYKNTHTRNPWEFGISKHSWISESF